MRRHWCDTPCRYFTKPAPPQLSDAGIVTILGSEVAARIEVVVAIDTRACAVRKARIRLGIDIILNKLLSPNYVELIIFFIVLCY